MLWQCRCNELMSNLNFATLPMFELKVEWFTEEGQANWMDPLVDWMRATGMDPEGDPLMIKPASGYAGVGVQPVRGALAVGHAAMDLFATVSASSATQWTAQWRLIAPRWHPGDRLCCQGALFAPVSAKLPFPDARIVVCWHTTKAIAWLDGVMLADWGHAVLLLHFDWLQGCTTWPVNAALAASECGTGLASYSESCLHPAAGACTLAGSRQLSTQVASKPHHVTCPGAWAACAAICLGCLAGSCCNSTPQWLTLCLCNLPLCLGYMSQVLQQGHTGTCIAGTQSISGRLGSNPWALPSTAEAQNYRGCRVWMIPSLWSPGSHAGVGMSTASLCLRVPSKLL